MSLKKIDSYLTAQAKTDNFSGVVLVARKNTVLLRKGYGYANRMELLGTKRGFIGYGLVIGPAAYNYETTLGHGGGTGSFSSYLFHFLPSDTTIIILINYGSLDLYTQELLAEFIRAHAQESKKTLEYSI